MDASVTETYLGEWKNDKRTGFGISERSDGLRYEGEWFNNRKYGYGVTTFRDGTKEEGKYKNNVLITSQKKKHLFLIRSAKFRERIEAAVNAAQRASKIALQKADIAISRTATARGRAELADVAAEHAREDSELAQQTAKQFAPDFRQPGLERLRNREIPKYVPPPQDTVPGKSILHKAGSVDHGPMKGPASGEEPTSMSTASAASAGPNMMHRNSIKPSQQANQVLTNQLPQNQLTQNEIQSQVTPATLVNQLPLNQLNQTTLTGENSYQALYPQPMVQSPMQQGYPNSIPNQYQQMGQLQGQQMGQYPMQNQYPAQGSPYGPQYAPVGQPQQEQYLYQQQQMVPQGYPNMQAYSNQQVTVFHESSETLTNMISFEGLR